ncbi:MAG: hypothetical protein NUV51_08015 [Sulfuricaulis sp.]|nr:hypothetical protein [Sulfuricaulis sp.]
MTPAEIRAAIAADPALSALLPDSQAIAEAMSAGRTRANTIEIGNGLILATVGLEAGNALLDVMNSAADFRHVKPLLEQGRLAVSSPLVVATLNSLVGTVLTQEQSDALIALGRDPDPVAELDVRRAIWLDDGTRAI